MSERHAWRLLAAYRARGAAALAHGNRRRRPHNAVPADVASAVVRLAATRYPGANHTHLAELLWEHEGLDVSSWTVRRILARVGIPSPRRRRPPEHRVRRERMPREGMLLQVDGSHHAWLEGAVRVPPCCSPSMTRPARPCTLSSAPPKTPAATSSALDLDSGQVTEIAA